MMYICTYTSHRLKPCIQNDKIICFPSEIFTWQILYYTTEKGETKKEKSMLWQLLYFSFISKIGAAKAAILKP